MESLNLNQRPKMSIAHNAIREVSNKLASNEEERNEFILNPVKYLKKNSLGSYNSCELNNSEHLALTSEACTAVAICVVAVLVGAVAVSGVAAALYVYAYAAMSTSTVVSSSGR